MRSGIRFLGNHNTEQNDFKLHSHDCHEAIYFLSGKGSITIGDSSFPVAANTYCIVSPETNHTECLDGDGDIIFIGFDCNNKSLNLKEGVYQSTEPSVLSFFQKILDEYQRQHSNYEIAANAFLDLLLVTYARNAGDSNKKCKDLNYIKAYIEQYYNQKISFRQLAALSGYSYDYFRHIFRQKFGISPQEYLIEIRLKNAKQLLESTALSCIEISYNCGFSNSSQMTMMFRKRYNKQPSAFRITDLYKNSHES